MKNNIFKQKIKVMRSHISTLLSTPIVTLIFVSMGCGGCGGVKDVGKEKIVSLSPKNKIESTAAKVDIGKIDTTTLIRTSFPELITFKYYNQEKNQFEQYDEYNYARKILVFKDSKTKNVIKEIDIVKDSPFHAQGFKRKNESYTSIFHIFCIKKEQKISTTYVNIYPVKYLMRSQMILTLKEEWHLFHISILPINT
ncbi:MAG: hypothetical protein IPO92_14000 [Saprospiraceae bacterium]|nr:hypothetical protein [Saprospiraceae bacterium]